MGSNVFDHTVKIIHGAASCRHANGAAIKTCGMRLGAAYRSTQE